MTDLLAARARWLASQPMTLEQLLTSPSAFGLASATRLQRDIARAADGLPIEPSPFFGGVAPTKRPLIVEIIAGVRSGKSLMAGAAGWHSACCADLSALRPNERARVAIVAPTVDNANATFRLLTGALHAPALAPLVADVSGSTVLVRRPDGRFVEIVVVAAHRGAVTLRSRWLAGFVFDEVALFGQGELGYQVNAEELLKGAEPRLLPAGQGWLISSPYGSQGLLYELWREYFGKPGRVLVVRAPTLEMVPKSVVSPSIVEELRARDPDTAAREFDAAWTDPEQALLPAAHVDAAIRPERPREDLHHYFAAMDPGTRSNAWTLAIGCRRRRDGRMVSAVVKVRQWQGSKTAPLSPDEILKEIAAELGAYGIKEIMTDQYAADALRDIAKRHGLVLYEKTITHLVKVELFEGLRAMLADDAVELPPDPQVRGDLLLVKKRIGLQGVTIELPRTPDGRHCDYAIAVAMLLAIGLKDPDDPIDHVQYGSAAWYERERQRDKERAILDAARRAREERPAFWRPEYGRR